MPIGCTRCGAKQEGEILTPPIAFKFPHEKGCGHGVGPLAVIKGKIAKPKEPTAKEVIVEELKSQIEEIKVEKVVEKSTQKKEKIKVYGQKD
jgi:hypothetical protein